MRLPVIITFCILGLSTFSSCTKDEVYAQASKTLDSLDGTLSSLTRELESVDTNLLSRTITRYVYYKQFIEQNVNDTLSKNEADDLRHFYEAGENLQRFQTNRKLLLSRASLINQQLTRLSEDAGKRNLESAQLLQYCRHENSEMSTLTALGKTQLKIFYTTLETYKNSLKGVEVVIRSRNNGDLPTIIKDTISL